MGEMLTWIASYHPMGEPSVDAFVAVAPGSTQWIARLGVVFAAVCIWTMRKTVLK